MKPTKLTLQAFGPFVKETVIDFSELVKGNEKQIFLITGDTGCGKSFILDGICYALYKEGAYSNRDVRSDKAEGIVPTIAELDFEIGSDSYRIRREILVQSKKGKPYDKPKCSAVLSIKDGSDYNVLSSSSTGKAETDKIQEIIRLDRDRFVQLVVLPQGQFSEFLKNTGEKRTEILSALFSSEINIYEKTIDIIKKKSAAAADEVKNLQTELNSIYDNYSEAVEGNADRVSALANYCSTQNTKFNELKNQVLPAAQKDEQIKQKAFNDGTKLSKDFDALDKANKDKQKLDNQKPEIEQFKVDIKKIDAAQKIKAGTYTVLKNAEESLSRQNEDIAKEEKEINKAQSEYDKAEAALDSLKKQEASVNSSKNEKTRLETIRPHYEKDDELKNNFDKAKTAREQQDTAVQNKKEELTKALEEGKKLQDKFNNAREKYDRLSKAYYDNIFGIEAAKLTETSPCPICGSTNHPKKAPIAEGDIPTEKEKNTAKQQQDEADKATNKKAAEIEQLQKELDKEKDALADGKSAEDKAETEWKINRKSLDTAYPDLTSLDKKISELETAAADYDKKLQKAEEKEDSTKNNLNSHKTAKSILEVGLQTMDENKINADTAFREELRKNNIAEDELLRLADSDKSQLQNTIDKWGDAILLAENEIKRLQQNTTGKTKPDTAWLKNDADNAKEKTAETNRQIGNLENSIADITRDLTNAADKEKLLTEKEKISGRLERLYKYLNGDKHLPGLKEYILGMSFSRVVEKANEYLDSLFGSRYRLFVAAQNTTRGKCGLDLTILDKESSRERTINSLSGGETFMVSMSLAKGLSEMVREIAGADTLDSLFIDEGFGTLDETCRKDAVNMIQNMGAGKLIGIVSHVDALKENIQNQLEVFKQPDGSGVRIVR